MGYTQRDDGNKYLGLGIYWRGGKTYYRI